MEKMDGSPTALEKFWKAARVRDILFAILVLALAAASILVMLQSAGIIRYDRF